MKVGTNEHDDAEDATTGTVEQRGKSGVNQDLTGFFYKGAPKWATKTRA